MFGQLEITQDLFESFLAERGLQCYGKIDEVEKIKGVEPINEARYLDATFCRFDDESGAEYIKNTKAGLIFIPQKLYDTCSATKAILVPCEFPRLEILKFISAFWRESRFKWNSSDNPNIHHSATVAADARIGPFSVIGPGVVIGSGSQVGSGCHIENTLIGSKVKIGSNVTIGGSGFGFEDDPVTGEILEFPHVGGVVIGDNSSIGSSTCIDRGSIGNTYIGKDTKIDNLVHVAHNVTVGDRCKIIALSIIGGSVKIGDDSWISPGVSIRDWRNIGNGAIVGIGAVVTKDVEPKAIVVGNPAKPLVSAPGRYK